MDFMVRLNVRIDQTPMEVCGKKKFEVNAGV